MYWCGFVRPDSTVGPVSFNVATAILRAYTPDGFVIVADGRRLKSDLIPPFETMQKIFSIGRGGHHIACGFAGLTYIDRNNGEVLLDLAAEAVRVAEYIDYSKGDTLVSYSVRLARALNRYFRNTQKRHKLPLPLDPEVSMERGGYLAAKVGIEALYVGIPQRVEITLSYDYKQFREPDVANFPVVQSQRFSIG